MMKFIIILRPKELESKGILFTSQSDTEVIMRSYEFWGIKFVNKLKGMFSIVIFDKVKNKFFFQRPCWSKTFVLLLYKRRFNS